MITNDNIMLSRDNWKMIAVRLPEEDISKLNRLADKRCLSREAFIRECIFDKIKECEA